MDKIKLVIRMKARKPSPSEELEGLLPLRFWLRQQLYLSPRNYLNRSGQWKLWYMGLGGEIIVSEFKVLEIYEKKN